MPLGKSRACNVFIFVVPRIIRVRNNYLDVEVVFVKLEGDWDLVTLAEHFKCGILLEKPLIVLDKLLLKANFKIYTPFFIISNLNLSFLNFLSVNLFDSFPYKGTKVPQLIRTTYQHNENSNFSFNHRNLYGNTLISAQKSWCGKAYIPRKQARSEIPSINKLLARDQLWKRVTTSKAVANDTGAVTGGSTPATIVIPAQNGKPIPSIPNLAQGYAAMVRFQPYLESDSQGSLVINVGNPSGQISVQAVLDDGTEVLAKTKVDIKDMAVEVPFSISNIKSKLTAYTLKVLFFNGGNSNPTFTANAKLYRLPAGPKTVKIDRLFGGIITSIGEPIFPIGPYVDFGWLGAGDIAANLKKLKDLGYNVINPDPTYTDLSAVDKMFQAADALGGIYIQLSFRYSFTDIQKVVSQVNQFKKYSSLLTWYTADEPDGEQFTDSSAELNAYNAIKAADPYHPVALVLNCELTAAFYADTTDILSMDVYPIGVDMSHCTTTNDVCGCDNCIGSATLDVPKRSDQFMKDLSLIGRQAINQWQVLQAFADPPTWWSRMPTVQEFRVMSYISIIYGFKSIMFWKYPFTPNDSLQIGITQIAKEANSLIPYILGTQQLPASHVTVSGKSFYAGGWLSRDGKSFLAIVVNGDPKSASSFNVNFKDLAGNSLTGNGVTDSGKSSASLKDGTLSGTLKPMEVGVYTLGSAPGDLQKTLKTPLSLTSNDGSSSSSSSSLSSSSSSDGGSSSNDHGTSPSSASIIDKKPSFLFSATLVAIGFFSLF
ncbi:hypothetical protein G9A89_001580 [Geosiphon pyriformis]|nr:hypothetical protein G9A89_001580 [Geosiphon pyriformis]